MQKGAWLPIVFAMLVAAVWLSGCGTTQRRAPGKPLPPNTQSSGGYYEDDGPGTAPPNLELTPDAVARYERPHKFANQPYTVFGKTYVPAAPAAGTRLSGHASWYGRKFHGKPTAIGETYDMYAMSAAHPTLPLPSYARVTNPANGRSVVVRVNDRGPFLRERVIDLSYVAALKLGFVRQGSAWVEVEPILLTPAGQARVPASTGPSAAKLPENLAGHFVQFGAFRNVWSAESFQRRLAVQLAWLASALHVAPRGDVLRVRAGPYATEQEAQRIAQQVGAATGLSPVTTGF